MSTMRTETNIMNIMNTTSTNSSVLTIPRAIFDQRNSDRSYERRQIDATGLPYRRPQNDPNALHQKYHPPPPPTQPRRHACYLRTNKLCPLLVQPLIRGKSIRDCDGGSHRRQNEHQQRVVEVGVEHVVRF